MSAGITSALSFVGVIASGLAVAWLFERFWPMPDFTDSELLWRQW